MRKLLLVAIIVLSSITTVIAADLDPIAQAKALLDQYSTRVRALETENAILREEMRKAGITIPLSLFSGAIQTSINTGTTSVVAPSTQMTLTGSMATGANVSQITASGEISFANIEKTHGASYAGFIKRIISEWDKVRDVYAMPRGAHIGGYELVESGALDHIFVDINYTGATSGSGYFDAKILYQFDKSTYARKLIGFFEYNTTTGYYTTKTGKNIFAGVKRTWVADPRSTASVVAPVPSTTATTTPPPTDTMNVNVAAIESAYTNKRYLSVISLSTTWLAMNPPTLDILRIRYRTYFIIGKYSEALAEIGRIQSIGQLSSAVACEGAIIAGPKFGNSTTLAASYQTTCNKK